MPRLQHPTDNDKHLHINTLPTRLRPPYEHQTIKQIQTLLIKPKGTFNPLKHQIIEIQNQKIGTSKFQTSLNNRLITKLNYPFQKMNYY